MGGEHGGKVSDMFGNGFIFDFGYKNLILSPQTHFWVLKVYFWNLETYFGVKCLNCVQIVGKCWYNQQSSKIGRTNLAEPFAWTLLEMRTTAATVAAAAAARVAAESAAKLQMLLLLHLPLLQGCCCKNCCQKTATKVAAVTAATARLKLLQNLLQRLLLLYQLKRQNIQLIHSTHQNWNPEERMHQEQSSAESI